MVVNGRQAEVLGQHFGYRSGWPPLSRLDPLQEGVLRLRCAEMSVSLYAFCMTHAADRNSIVKTWNCFYGSYEDTSYRATGPRTYYVRVNERHDYRRLVT